MKHFAVPLEAKAVCGERCETPLRITRARSEVTCLLCLTWVAHYEAGERDGFQGEARRLFTEGYNRGYFDGEERFERQEGGKVPRSGVPYGQRPMRSMGGASRPRASIRVKTLGESPETSPPTENSAARGSRARR